MELWDAYDDRLRPIEGVTLVRGEPVPEGMFHLVCEVAVRRREGNWRLMKRAPEKPLGGLWELTAGGAAQQGEDPLTAACRELREETGLSGEMIPLGHILHRGWRTWFVEYLCICDGPREAVTLQPGETVDFRWVSEAELRSMPQEALATTRMGDFLWREGRVPHRIV